MSLKLCCALPVTLNCLKSSRILFLAPEYVNISKKPLSQVNFCLGVQSRWLSTDKNIKTSEKKQEKNKESPFKQIYHGPLSPHVRAVKLFSVSSSVVGLTLQPALYKAIVSTGNVPIILAAYSFIGFFTVVTPFLLHFITKKYVMELHYNNETDTYLAKTLNLFCAIKETHFKVDEVEVPDLPGMFVSCNIKGKPFFLDPRHFDQPAHYMRIMGLDKPMDFKLYENDLNKTENVAPDPTANSGTNK